MSLVIFDAMNGLNVFFLEIHLFLPASEARRGEPEEMVIIVGVDPPGEHAHQFLAITGEDPAMVSVEEGRASLGPRRWRLGSLSYPANIPHQPP